MCSPVDRSWNSEFASNNFTHYRYDSNFITKIKNEKNCNVSLWSKIEVEQINRIFDYFIPADNAPNKHCRLWCKYYGIQKSTLSTK
jgi:hypothetical protein